MANDVLAAVGAAQIAALGISNIALVTPEDIGYLPQDDNGLTGLKSIIFNYEQDNQATLESDITNNYVEDNSSRVDQISLKPETVIVSGVVGELNNLVPAKLKTAKAVVDKLFLLSYYTPELSVVAQRAYNAAAQAYDTADKISRSRVSSIASLAGTGQGTIGSSGLVTDADFGTQTKQQTYFQQFYGYWSNRTLFTIQTPWAIFKNMAIASLRAVQSSETKQVSDFEITFKMVRYASTKETSLSNSNYSGSGRNGTMGSPIMDGGSQTPTTWVP